MKAAFISAFGGPDAIQYGEIEDPKPGAGEVLIRVAATTFNPVDAVALSGFFKEMFVFTFPFVPGIDVSGVVEQVGEGVTTLKAGDRVISRLDINTAGGAGEFVVASAQDVALAPASISLAEAAAIPASGLTSWQGLFVHGGVKAGDRVLITAAAGGVGAMAVQLAKVHGAYVIGTASPARFEMLRALGVDQLVDYSEDLASAITEPVDVVFNLAPPSVSIDPMMQVLKPGGRLVSASAMVDEVKAKAAGIVANRMAGQKNTDQLNRIVALIDGGKIKPLIGKRLPASATADAHRAAGSTFGKVVLIVDEGLAEQKG